MTRVLVPLAVIPIVVLGGCSSPGDHPEGAARDVVDAAYSAFNSGDIDGWAEVRDRGSQYASDEDRTQAMAQLRTSVRSRIEAGAQYQDISCESHGHGDWPVADAGDVTGYYFTCATVLTQDGTEVTENFEWVVDDGQVVAVRSDR